MNNLCYGMKTINISQLPGNSYSHPNGAMDLWGCNNNVDFWWAQGSWKCIAGPWGAGTYFFVSCDDNGVPTAVHCADGIDRIVTIAMTHSLRQYVKTTVGRIYKNGQPMYEEGTNSHGSIAKITGNHIHLEVANGIRTSKYYDNSMKCWRMAGELNPLKVFFVRDDFSTVATKTSLGINQLRHCATLKYTAPSSKPTPSKEDDMIYLQPKKSPVYVRQALTFNKWTKKNTSKVLATIPAGTKARITHFTERFEVDGYEWCQVDYNGIAGYCQLDTKEYLVRID